MLTSGRLDRCPAARADQVAALATMTGRGDTGAVTSAMTAGYIVSRTGGGPEEDAMKFMFTIYHDEQVLDAMPEAEMQALVDSAIEYAEALRQSGHYVVSSALQRTKTGRIVRPGSTKVSTTVGPFAETKEQLGGFFVIEARDIDEACALAAKFPPLRVGAIEVRPVNELQHSRDRRGLPSTFKA
jgi:hypothetical protein